MHQGGPAAPAAAPASPAVAAATSEPLPLSVVVPTHETRELTLRCLAALAAARPPASEVVVVDDGSTDGTAAAIAASYPAVRLLRQPQAGGFTAAVRAGVALARHEIVLLLNSDTEVEPAALAALVAAFARMPRLGIAGAALHYPDGTPQWSGGPAPGALWLLALASDLPRRLGRLRGWRRARPVAGHGERVRARVDWVPGAALACRREVWTELGGLDPRFALYAQDLDFCLQARARGWEVAVVPESRVLHHHGATVGAGAPVGDDRLHAERLWSDLVRWGGKRGGPAGARRVARWLVLGGSLQGLLLRFEGLGGGERARRATAARGGLRRAAAAARASAAAQATPPGAAAPLARRDGA
jgi:GT2 family glycosyltransferase